MNNNEIDKFIHYAINNINDERIELECRFGSYNKITSKINSTIFFNVFNTFASRKKTYTFIRDVLFNDMTGRYVINDKKKYVEKLFKTKNLENITKYSTEYYSKPQIYLSKKKVFNPVQYEKIKLDLSIENTKPYIDENRQYTHIKNKFRCSMKGLWNIDLSIILLTDSITNVSNIYFEIESEFNRDIYIKSKNSYDDTIYEFKNIMNSILTIIDCENGSIMDIEMRYSPYNQVVTLEKQYLNNIVYGKYSITEKADGERCFLFIDSKKKLYRINPSDIIPHKILLTKLGSISPYNTLIDCEMIVKDSKAVYLCFDILFYDGIDCRQFNLIKRLEYLRKIVKTLSKKLNIFDKKFYIDDIFNKAKILWNGKHTLFKYKLDGLIFTPVYGQYQGNLPIYKWKEKHSIDVRLMYNSKYNFTEFHPFTISFKKSNGEITNIYKDAKTNNIYYTKKINLNDEKMKQMGIINKHGYLGVHGKLKGAENLANMVDIVEIEWNPQGNSWEFLRVRYDKKTPNTIKSVISVLNAIVDNISIDELSKIKHIPSQVELNNNCDMGIGFNFTNSSIDSNICSFYTYAYENILKNRETVIVIGCDICMLRALSIKFKNILIIEPNCIEVYGEIKSEGYSGLKENALNMDNVIIVWGQSDISQGFKAFTKKGQNEINNFVKKWKIDIIIFGSFIDMFCQNYKPNPELFRQNMNMIKSLNVEVLGLYLNGSNIIKYLNNNPCLLTRDNKLHPLYKISLKNKHPKINPIFKNPEMIEIRTLHYSFESYDYPLISDKELIELVKNEGFKIKSDKYLGNYINKYTKISGVKISDYDSILANSLKYILF